MRYDNITEAEFTDRPNRFIAYVKIGNESHTVHVKNTGRCRELLIPGSTVYLTAPGTPGRKTIYDLVAVRKNDELLINMDSQAPNAVVREWLDSLGFDRIIPEYVYGNSRIDFYAEDMTGRYLIEVKGCTLEKDGTGYFPDAPTERGVKHLKELTAATEKGYHAVLVFVIQMDGVSEVRANAEIHQDFADALAEAVKRGVRVINLECHVEPDSLSVKYPKLDLIRERKSESGEQ
ncbi:MAG: DNA/RNA nuclease SfsA [Ruminobacter sp.]|uniref:DNA/RNA nuclease SfsA n=1 Tax=Ruminobacter sp. TaxID=2774296 RepID=UPI001B5EC67F|nr:DNA/RNA nuclease SfsA [Ruminobacter sp.]MBP3748787.1 DNA/RNA nuclease SfsA [Ruminobacter sp.]